MFTRSHKQYGYFQCMSFINLFLSIYFLYAVAYFHHLLEHLRRLISGDKFKASVEVPAGWKKTTQSNYIRLEDTQHIIILSTLYDQHDSLYGVSNRTYSRVQHSMIDRQYNIVNHKREQPNTTTEIHSGMLESYDRTKKYQCCLLRGKVCQSSL